MEKIIAIILSIAFSITGVGQSVIGFTEGTPIKATRREYKFDNQKLLIGGYYGQTDELDYAKEAGIDFIVGGTADKERLDKALQNGIGIIASHYDSLPTYYGTMSDEQSNSWVNHNFSNFANHDALWGCDLIDEPNSPGYAPIQKASKALYDNTTGILPYVNLFPNYADNVQLGVESKLNVFQKIFALFSDHFTDSCDRYKSYTSDYINNIDTDYICVDFYPYAAHQNIRGKMVKTTNSGWLRNLDLLAEACRETGRDLWVITQAAGTTKDGSDEGTRWCEDKPEISQQMYASLAFGAKAVIHGLFGRQGWWDADSHMIGSDGKPTPTFYSAKAVNLEVKRFAEEYGKYTYTSTYMLNQSKCAGFGKGTLNCEVEEEKGNIKSNDGLLIGTFTGENGTKAYIVTNMEELNNESTVHFRFYPEEGKTAKLYQGNDFKQIDGTREITLGPGEGVFITVE